MPFTIYGDKLTWTAFISFGYRYRHDNGLTAYKTASYKNTRLWV